MLKKLLYLALILGSIGVVVFVYFRLRSVSNELTDPWKLVPSESAVVVEITSFDSLENGVKWLRHFSNDSLRTSFPYALTGCTGMIEEMMKLKSADKIWSDVLSKTPVIFFTNSTAINNTWTSVIPFEDKGDSETLNALKAALGVSDAETKQFKEYVIFSDMSQGIHLARIENCLVVSESLSAIEEVLLSQEKDMSPEFNRLQKSMIETMATDVPMHFFFRDKQNWWQADLISVEGDFQLSGFAHLRDTLDNELQLVSSGNETSILGYAPLTTSLLETKAYKDFEEGWALHSQRNEGDRSAMFWSQAWQDFGDSCQCDLNESALSWRGNEWGNLVFSEGENSYSISFIEVRNGEDVLSKMAPLWGVDSTRYMGVPIRNIRMPQVFERNSFFGFMNRADFATFFGNFIFFSSNTEGLQALIKSNLESQTLKLSSSVANIQKSIGSAAGQLIYQNEYSISLLPENMINCFGCAIPLTVSISKVKSKLYSVNVLMTSPELRQTEMGGIGSVENLVRKTELGAGISAGPWFMKNHNSGQFEILVQDSQHILYLMDAEGVVLWTKQLDGSIVGEVKQIDALKNEKLQMVFSTTQQLHLLDRNSKELLGFPINYGSKLSSGLEVFDYDQNENYRLVGGLEDGSMFNYTVEGKMATGWIYQKSGNVVKALAHVRTKTDDCIIAVMTDEQIFGLKKNGQVKYQSKSKASGFQGRSFICRWASVLERVGVTYLDKSGALVHLELGTPEPLAKVKLSSGPIEVSYTDLNRDGIDDALITYEKEMRAFDYSLKSLMSISLPELPEAQPLACRMGKSSTSLGVSLNNGKGYEISFHDGTLREVLEFTSTRLAIFDLDLDGQNEVIGISDRSIMIKAPLTKQ